MAGRQRFLVDRIRSGRHAGHYADWMDQAIPGIVQWNEERLRSPLTGPLVQVLSDQSGRDLAEAHLERTRWTMLEQIGQKGPTGVNAGPFEMAKLTSGRLIRSRLEPLWGVTWQLWASQSAHVRRAWFALAVLDGCSVTGSSPWSTPKELEWSRPGGYTRPDIGLISGVHGRSEQRRILERLMSLGVLYRINSVSGKGTVRFSQPRYLFVGWPFPEHLSYEWHPGYGKMLVEMGRLVRAYEMAWLRRLRNETRAEIRRIDRTRPPHTVAELFRESTDLFDLPDRVKRAHLGMGAETPLGASRSPVGSSP